MRARVIRFGSADGVRRSNPERIRLLQRKQLGAARAAEALLSDARQQAQQLTTEAEAEASRRVAEALAQADAQYAVRLLALEQQAASRLRRDRAKLRDDVARLAVAVAEKVLGQQLTLRPQSVVQIVEQALLEVRPTRRALVRVHPEDLPQLERAIERLRAAVDVNEIALEADAAMDRGGCMVETPLVQADARLTVQLERLARVIAATIDTTGESECGEQGA